jgi:hypothetical protein
LDRERPDGLRGDGLWPDGLRPAGLRPDGLRNHRLRMDRLRRRRAYGLRLGDRRRKRRRARRGPRRRGRWPARGHPEPDALSGRDGLTRAGRLSGHDALRLIGGCALHLADEAMLQQDHLGDDHRHASDAGHERLLLRRRLRRSWTGRRRRRSGRRRPWHRRPGSGRRRPAAGRWLRLVVAGRRGPGRVERQQRADQGERDRRLHSGVGCARHRLPFGPSPGSLGRATAPVDRCARSALWPVGRIRRLSRCG